MTEEEAIDILDAENVSDNRTPTIAVELIAQYTQGEAVICAAESDIIFGPDLSELIEGGITVQDLVRIRENGWFYDEEFECISHFV